jgi:hypothetical protein
MEQNLDEKKAMRRIKLERAIEEMRYASSRTMAVKNDEKIYCGELKRYVGTVARVQEIFREYSTNDPIPTDLLERYDGILEPRD